MKIHVGSSVFNVRWRHHRKYTPVVVQLSTGIYDKPEYSVTPVMSAKGGWTECLVEQEGGSVGIIGAAYCSDKDNYNKSIGRRKSLMDAVRDLQGLPRKLVWECYERSCR